MDVDIDKTIGVNQIDDGGLAGFDYFDYMMTDDFRTSSVNFT